MTSTASAKATDMTNEHTSSPNDSFTQEAFYAYVECALWSSTVDVDEETGEPVAEETGETRPMDDYFDALDIAPGSYESMRDDVTAFVDAEWADLEGMSPGQAGHDFWLTRNRHGAGFWDRGLGERGQRLTDAAHVYGVSDLYIGGDGRVYVS